MSGIGVVLNPFSKRFKKDPSKLEHMAFIIGDKASCKPTEDMADLQRVADEFKSRDIDVLAISGGDGTIHCTLTEFIKVYGDKPLPKIHFLRGGTLNTIAASMGIKGNTETLMSELLVRYHEDKEFKVKKLRLTKINDSYGCIFGMGVIYKFMEDYYNHPKLNAFVAGKTVTQTIISALSNGKASQRIFKRFDADVTVNGVKWPYANYSALFSGSIRQLGLEFNVFNSMLRQNKNFHAVGISMSPRELLPLVKPLHDGKSIEGVPGFVEAEASSMEIVCAEPMAYTIDGDMLPGETHFSLRPGPEITVLV